MSAELVNKLIDAQIIEQVGTYCTYHRGFCHNPLDCDNVRTFRFTTARNPDVSERLLQALDFGESEPSPFAASDPVVDGEPSAQRGES